MAENKLNIAVDDDVPAEVAANAADWITSIVEWLLAQPQPAGLDGIQPRFSEIKYRVHPHPRNFGLRSKDDGAGWLNLGVSDDLKIEVRGDFPSFTVIPTATVIACQGNWSYVISQLLYPNGYYKDSFNWQECLGYQLRYLDDLAKNNRDVRSLLDSFEQQQQELAEVERMKKYRQQFTDSRLARQKRQREAWAIRTPQWYWSAHEDAIVSQHESEETKPNQKHAPAASPQKPHYCEHQSPPPLPPQPPKQHPTPQLSPEDARALETIERQQQYMASYCMTEDGDM